MTFPKSVLMAALCAAAVFHFSASWAEGEAPVSPEPAPADPAGTGAVDASGPVGPSAATGGVAPDPEPVPSDPPADGSGTVAVPAPEGAGGSSSGAAEIPVVAPPPALRAAFDFQIPTYFLEKEDPELGAYSCDPAKPECRVNLDLSPTFSGASASAWECSLDFGMGVPTGEEGKCNPNAVTLTGTAVTVRLRAWPKADPAAVREREFAVTVRAATSEAATEFGPFAMDSGTGAAGDPAPAEPPTGTGGEVPDAQTPSEDAAPPPASSGADSVAGQSAAWPDPAVVVQSGLDGQGRCLKADCVANFASSLSGSAYACSWDLGGGTFSSASSSGSCNPSYARFPTGAAYRVALTVRHRDGAEKTAYLDAVNPFAAPVTVTVVERTLVASASAEPPAFPPAARISLQGRLSANRWADGKSAGCVAETASGCSFNFDGRSSSAADLAAAAFSWDYGFGTGASGPNPPAVRFAPGAWTVRLRVSDAHGSSVDEWRVEVLRDKAAASVPAAPAAPAGSGSVAAPPASATVCGQLADGTRACLVPEAFPVAAQGVPAAFAAGAPAEGASAEISFSPAPFSVRIGAQGPWGAGRSFTGGAYFCATKETSCSVNFSASATGAKASSWLWEFPDGTYAGANPPARAFAQGASTVRVTATSQDGRTARDEVRVSVGPAAKKAPAKNAVKKSAPRESGGPSVFAVSEAPVRAVFSAEPQGPLEANAPLGWAAAAASGASGLSWLLARRWGK